MYQLTKETITKIKRAFTKVYHCPNPFEFDELNNPPKKTKLFSKPKHPENLGIDVYKDLKIKTSLADGMEEEGLSITSNEPNNLNPLVKLLNSLDLHWQYYDGEKLNEYGFCAGKELMYGYNLIKDFKTSFDTFIIEVDFIGHDDKDDGTKFNEFNNLIHNYCYDFSGNVDMNEYVGSQGELEVYKAIDDFLSSFVLMLDRVCVVKNFLIKVEEKNKKSYIINTSNEKVTEIKQGENLNMKTVNGKNKVERMINKPLKYMGLKVTNSSSNKHLYAEVEEGDFNKYAYYVVYENPIPFNQTLANGRTINKYCFHVDNFDDGKGHDAIFVPSGMVLELVNGNVSEKVGYLVAFERNQGNNQIIESLNKLDAGADSIEVMTPDKIKGLKYHY